MKLKNIKKHFISNKGQSLFELLVAIAMVSLVLVAIISLTTTAVGNTTLAREKSLAAKHTQEGMEWLRNQRDLNWDAFIARGTSEGKTWCLSSLNWSNPNPCTSTAFITQTRFIREGVVTYDAINSPDTINVVVTTRWSGKGGDHQSNATTTHTNWKAN